MLQQAVDDAGPVEPGGDREAPGDGGGLEPADFLHPPDVQLQVRAACGQRVQAMFRGPGQEAAQVGFGVVTGGAFETGQVGSHREPQLISERHQVIGRDGQQGSKGPHAQTVRREPPAAKPKTYPARQSSAFRHTCRGAYLCDSPVKRPPKPELVL